MRSDPMLRALRFFGLGARPIGWSVLLGAAGALSALGLAALSAWLITRAWQMPPVLYLAVAVTAVRALGISRALFRYLERLATHNAALDAMTRARTRIYRVLANGSPAYSVGLKQSQLLARTADDVDDIGNAMIRGLIPMAVGAVTALAAVIIMAVVSPLAAVILAVALAVSGVVAPWLAARGAAAAIAGSARAREDVADETSVLLWHGPELVVAGRRGQVLEDLRAADRRLARTTDTGAAWEVSAASATPLALGVSVVAAALIAVDLATRVTGSLADASPHDTRFTPMLFGVLVLLPLSSFEMTGPLTEAGIAWQRGRQAARRILGLVAGAGGDPSTGLREQGTGLREQETGLREQGTGLGEQGTGRGERGSELGGQETERGDPVFATAPTRLTADQLQWGWDRPLGPEGGLDVSLEPGARLVVVGPSGCGKSSLLMTLAGLLPPLGGTVTGSEAACYFAEEGHIFSTSVRENLLVARGDATDQQVCAALEAVGLSRWVNGLPDGLDTDLTGGGAALSGGQRRRLLVARALLHPAPIVLLDEPAEHLDTADARAMMERICARGDSTTALFGPERTVVVVTHQHAVAAGAVGARLLSLSPR